MLYLQTRSLTYPYITKGRLVGAEKNVNYFDVGIFVYHGNSGGPLISKNKMIAFVHGPADIDIDFIRPLLKRYIESHLKLIKSIVILPFLRDYEKNMAYDI